MVGRLLDGRYQIRSRIARGGMATVYLATDLRLERKVAVKVMHGHLADDAAFRERFIREARSAARLAHPNVVAVFDQGEDGESAYLVMEYLPGITLRELLQEHKVLTTEQTLDVMQAVLSGLAAAHRSGIVHRDLKPENVMLADDGRIKIGDFGLARAVSANTATGAALLGTIAYLSPELVTRGVADARSDIYAIGILMYEMLTGEQPYKGDQPVQIAYQHANSTVPPPSDKNPRVPAELDELVQWATARNPEDRPADASVLLEQLRDAHASLMTALPGTGSDTGARTAIFPASGPFPTGDTTIFPRATTGATVVLPGTQLARGRQATGPQVSANTASLAIKTRRRRSRGWIWLAIVLVLALAGAGVGLWFGVGPGSRAEVPGGLEGMSPALAENALVQAGFIVGETRRENSASVPADQVMGTDPAGGSSVARGSTIDLIVSDGPRMIALPKVIGEQETVANAALSDFALADPIQQFSQELERGIVIDILDADGTSLEGTRELAEGSEITLLVAAGPLPDLARSPVESATAALERLGILVDPQHIEQHDDLIPKDTVIGLKSRDDGPVNVGDTVKLIVSLGPELFAMPDVIGLTIAEAIDVLEGQGFSVADTGFPPPFREIYVVTETSPKAGEMIAKSTPVVLTKFALGG